MTMTRIKEIWEILENNTSAVPGLFRQRYSDTSICDIFLGVKWPEKFRILIVRVPFEIGKSFNFRYEFKGMKFEKIYDQVDNRYILLNLVLIDTQFKDVFDSLIQDVIIKIINESDIKLILKHYTDRLIKWQSLFDRYDARGLAPEEQRGLYGELHFLRKYLKSCTDYLNVISSWVGPENQNKDFQFGKWAVEIKTTHGNNHQRVIICSERQLDTQNLDNLFLDHLSLDIRRESGETLINMIDSIADILNSDFNALLCFKNKLIEARYFEHQRILYSNIGYLIRNDNVYKVEGDFPRIEEKDIRSGVGDVKYSIITSYCSQYEVNEADLFAEITFH